jgi:hypothetical protein
VKRLVTQLFAALAAVAFGLVAFAATASTPVFAQAPAPDFGSPPSGEVPILFNDTHVYSKPDRLKKARVLAALVRGKTILVPLRSMFEQMGATVSYNPGTKTVDVSKPGADVQVTVGKPEVVINGESRPLDVPPEIYKGSIVVPVRVISEGMGAYVQWVPEKRVVVVRYLPAPIPTPAPTAPPPPPTAAPTAAPTAPPTPTPTKAPQIQFFAAGDDSISPITLNEFRGTTVPGDDQFTGRVGLVIPFNQIPVLVEGTYTWYSYPHLSSGLYSSASNFGPNPVCGPGGAASSVGDPGCVTIIGGQGQVYVPTFTADERVMDGRIGIGIANPSIFLVAAYESRYGNYGYPTLNGYGGGIEKIPDFNQPLSFFGSVLYFPEIGSSTVLQYRLLKYQAGLQIAIPHTPLSLEGGYMGDRGTNKLNAPSNFTHNQFFAGLGLHF